MCDGHLGQGKLAAVELVVLAILLLVTTLEMTVSVALVLEESVDGSMILVSQIERTAFAETVTEGRLPSYCDRILWIDKYTEQLLYRSHGEFGISDHKPVSALFKVGSRCVDRYLFAKAYEAVIRSQDLVYNMSLPQATLSTQEEEFGAVRFDDICQDSIVIRKVGFARRIPSKWQCEK
ncbi:hypothetical protein SprV_0602044500 [Sparganum proliferum]